MLPCSTNVNAMPRKVRCALDIGNDTITDVKKLTYATDWSGQITVGQVVSAYISATVPTPNFSLAGANVSHSMGIGDPVEWVQIGTYRIDEESIRTRQGYTSFSAYDKLRYAINTYHSALSYPTSLQAICNEVCGLIGITSATLPVNPSFTADSDILNMLDGYILRDVLGFIAAYCGKNAYLSPSGALDLRWFSSTSYTADGTRANIPYIGENDCTVGRLICQTQDGVITSGSGEGIYFTCPFMTQARLNAMLSGLSFTYRKADVDIPYGSFLLQSGDIITVSTTGSNLSVPIMDNSWTFDGGLSSAVVSYGVSDYQGNANNAERSLSAARVQKQMAAYRAHTELETATQIITGAVGGYIKINFGNDGKTAELLVMDQPDINQALNVWVFNQNGLGHMERESTSDPFGTMNVALTRTGTVAADRIAGTMISGVGIENIDRSFSTRPRIKLADGCISIDETYSYDGQTEQETSIGKLEYLQRSGANNPATLALTCQLGNNITIGEYGYPKYVYRSQPTGTDKMHHFYGDVKFFDGVYVGDSLISAAALAKIVDSGAKNKFQTADDSFPGAWRDYNINLPAGNYVISFSSLSTTSSSTTIQMICMNGGSTTSTWLQCPVGTDTHIKFSCADTTLFRIYAANSYAASAGKTATFTGAMICDEVLWNISHSFVPYCPSMRELYDMIQNL